jgi:hypothetical protein
MIHEELLLRLLIMYSNGTADAQCLSLSLSLRKFQLDYALNWAWLRQVVAERTPDFEAAIEVHKAGQEGAVECRGRHTYDLNAPSVSSRRISICLIHPLLHYEEGQI